MKHNLWFRKVVDERCIDLEELADVLDLAPRTVKEYYSGFRKIGSKIRMNIVKILDLEEGDCDDRA